MDFLRIALSVIWFVSGGLSATFVLMHSGEGTGMADVIGISATRDSSSLGVMEKNLDRLTVVSVAVFMLTSLALMVCWPQAPIMKSLASAVTE